MDLTMGQINELNRTLGRKVMNRFIAVTAIKVGVAVGLAVLTKKMARKDIPED